VLTLVFTACAVSTQPDTSTSAWSSGALATAKSKNLIVPLNDSVVTAWADSAFVSTGASPELT
jgi:hypothetical protein